MFLMQGLDPIARLELAWNPPAMIDQKSMEKISNNAPRPMIKTEAYYEWVEREARRKLLKGPGR